MSWLRRNGGWLLGALLLAALAIGIPVRAVLEDRAGWEPTLPREVAAGAWAEYEGSRWRVADVELAPADAAAVNALGYRHDAKVLVVRFEVIPGPQSTAERLSQCKSRVSDRRGRYWEADDPPGSARRTLGKDCGHGPLHSGGEPAPIGRPFRFEKIYRIAPDTALDGLYPELRFLRNEREPQGTYLRFSLAPAPG